MKKREFKSDVQDAIAKVAEKHGVEIKLKAIGSTEQKGHYESVMVIDEASTEQASTRREGPTRREQVAKLIKKGVDSPKKIAEKIGTHPSYVSRLIKEVTTKNGKVKKEVEAQMA